MCSPGCINNTGTIFESKKQTQRRIEDDDQNHISNGAEFEGETIEEIANQVFADNPFRFVGHDPRTGDIVFEQKI